MATPDISNDVKKLNGQCSTMNVRPSAAGSAEPTAESFLRVHHGVDHVHGGAVPVDDVGLVQAVALFITVEGAAYPLVPGVFEQRFTKALAVGGRPIGDDVE